MVFSTGCKPSFPPTISSHRGGIAALVNLPAGGVPMEGTDRPAAAVYV
ncbi:MAG TPA: hypothetical protein PLN48_10340 [Lachnospiraceae bacterium]|nr:hypothetical protein [Lachnospiraceae bacterium]